MAKFNLKPNPTFPAKVGLHVPGADQEQLDFIFKFLPRTELPAVFGNLSAPASTGADSDVFDIGAQLEREADFFLGIVAAWPFEEALDRENVKALLNSRYGVIEAISESYLTAIRPAKAGNS
jgi:hypothetical protein